MGHLCSGSNLRSWRRRLNWHSRQALQLRSQRRTDEQDRSPRDSSRYQSPGSAWKNSRSCQKQIERLKEYSELVRGNVPNNFRILKVMGNDFSSNIVKQFISMEIQSALVFACRWHLDMYIIHYIFVRDNGNVIAYTKKTLLSLKTFLASSSFVCFMRRILPITVKLAIVAKAMLTISNWTFFLPFSMKLDSLSH